ncbi:MAG: hypothetical protein ABFD92_10005 [Planctomycetaceae bacterium]|nr:hypothetical protein [Planctomycetaceae bacterium]
MRLTRILAAIGIALVFIAAAPGQTVTPKGDNLVEVTVTGGGATEEEALADAMRKAVEHGAGQYISSHSEMKDFALVRDTVLSRSAGFLQSKKVLSKGELPDGTWQVKIAAVVSIKGIEDTWGVVTNLLAQVGRPKIMVFIRERIGGAAQDDSTVQTRIENLLLKSGFVLVDKEQLKEIDKKDIAAAAAEDSPARLQAVAKRFGAQIFISGVANATPGPTSTVGGLQLFPYQAESNIRCFRSDTGQLLASQPGPSTRGVDRVWRSAAAKALDAQAQIVAPKVVADVLQFWQDALAGRGEVQLHVEGVTFKQYTQIKARLKTVKNVKDLTASFHNQVVECSLQSDLVAEKLAEKLLDAMPELDISDVSANVIKAKFKSQ